MEVRSEMVIQLRPTPIKIRHTLEMCSPQRKFIPSSPAVLTMLL